MQSSFPLPPTHGSEITPGYASSSFAITASQHSEDGSRRRWSAHEVLVQPCRKFWTWCGALLDSCRMKLDWLQKIKLMWIFGLSSERDTVRLSVLCSQLQGRFLWLQVTVFSPAGRGTECSWQFPNGHFFSTECWFDIAQAVKITLDSSISK